MDLEKIAAAVMQHATVQNVHFNDIHDNENVYVGADGPTTRAASATTTTTAAPAATTPAPSASDALLPYILDDEDRSKVARALAQCRDTGQVALLAGRIYLDEILPCEVLRGADFQRTIMALLPFQTTEAALKQAILKQVK